MSHTPQYYAQRAAELETERAQLIELSKATTDKPTYMAIQARICDTDFKMKMARDQRDYDPYLEPMMSNLEIKELLLCTSINALRAKAKGFLKDGRAVAYAEAQRLIALLMWDSHQSPEAKARRNEKIQTNS